MTLNDLLTVVRSNVIIMGSGQVPLLKINVALNKNCLSEEYLDRKVTSMYAYDGDIYVHIEYDKNLKAIEKTENSIDGEKRI